MLKSLLCSTTAILLCAAPFAASAQDAETVVSAATRLPTPADQVASSVTVIDAAEIEARQQRSLPDVLRDVPGLNLVQSGGEGGQTSIFLRGANSNHTKVLVDGIDVSDPSTPNDTFDLGKFSAADIARVEVLRGPQSGLYGSDAVGGVIAIVTKSGEGPATLTANAEAGSFDSFNQDATLSGSSDALHYRVSVIHQHAGDTPVTPPAILEPGEKANGDFYDGVTASTKLGYDLSDNLDLGFSGRISSGLEKITGDGFSLVTFSGFPSPTQSRIATLQYQGRGTVHWDLGWLDQTAGLAYGSSATSDADPNNGYSRNQGARTKLDWQGNIKLADAATLVLGAETARDTIHAPISAGITTNAGFAELQTAFAGFAAAASLRYDDNSRFGGQLTWRVAPTYLIAATGTRLKASIGTGFKAPSLEDLYGPFGHNPDLKAETSTGYDLGLEQALFAGASAGVTWFHNDIADLIDTGPPPAYAPINIGKARTQGVEAFAAWSPWQTLQLRADYTYTEAEDTIAHTALLRRPQNKASLNALWQATAALSLDASLLASSGWSDVDREGFFPLKAGGYTAADLAVNYAITSMFTVYGRINNMFDTRYQNPSGFLQPGLGVYAGVKVAI